MTKNSSTLALGLLLILALIWGSSFILIKKGLTALSSEEVACLRIFSAFVVLLPFAISNLKAVEKSQWKYLLSIGLAGSLIPAFLFAIAQTRLESALVGIMNTLTPLFTILIARVIYGHTQARRVYLGVALGFIGSIFLISGGNGSGIVSFNPYSLLIVLATIFYATNLNIIKEHLQGLKALPITSISLFIVGPIAGIYLFSMTNFPDKLHNIEEMILPIAYIVILGVVGTSLALIIFNHIVRLTNPLFTSSVTYIIPIVALMWGLWDGERLVIFHYIGMVLVIAGVYLANRPKKSNVEKA